ncbi:hypothetical protein HA402_011198 [Bradysia odoriphaga]|nr:hypothetical protein HA402_011198 [Bradysia odoriphaga]
MCICTLECLSSMGVGELTTHLSRLKRFEEKLSRFYGAQVVLALQYLHHMGIIYRDLKPENVCINADGYIRICDFGFSKKIDDGRTYSFCGTPDYLAPEIILHIGYSFSVDFWTLGVFLYEMNAGYAPFTDENAATQYDKIVKGKFQCPSTFTRELTDLVNKLIVVDRTSRYGCLKNGYSDIKLHDWFDDIDWSGIHGKKVKPMLLPKIDSENMGANFFQQSNLELRKNSVDEYSYLFSDFN